MQKTSVFLTASLLRAQNKRNVLKCFVGFIVQQNKTFPCFVCDKQMPPGKPMFIAYVITLKMKQNLAKKTTTITCIHIVFTLICKKKNMY